jgi:hypothetical protein
MNILLFLKVHSSEVFALLFALSELLANIPSVASNSVFQLIFSFLKAKEGVPVVPPAPADQPAVSEEAPVAPAEQAPEANG